jgi:hypothetical protein
MQPEPNDDDDWADLTLAEFSERCPIAARELMRAVIPAISTVLEKQPDTPDKWGAAFAVGASFCFGRSMSEKAAQLGCSRALLSHKATEICKALGWPPSAYMKSEEAAEVAREARNRVVNKDLESLIETSRKKGIIK